MRSRKLLIGLVIAGAFTGGFGAGVFPAGAELQTVTTAVDGQTVTVDDTSATSTTTTTTTTTATTPTDPGTTVTTPADPAPVPAPEPSPPAPAADPGASAPAPQPQPDAAAAPTTPTVPATPPGISAGGQHGQETTGDTISDAAPPAPAPLREDDGAPTPANPGFSEALPGAAPIGVPNFFIDKFRIPPFLLPIYQAAGIEYGVRWEILAAINEIETDYGRNLNVSSAGALGWMQFMPSTWDQYGVDANHDGLKDPYNPVDAIFATARYLKAAGADTDVRQAIYAYNHADWYVDSVLMRARLIGGLPADLVGSLTGLTEGRFPVAAKATYADDLTERSYHQHIAQAANVAMPVEANTSRRGINVYAKPGSAVIATQDGRITRIGTSARLGRFIQLRDVYGNTYTYAQLGSIAPAYAVPKAKHESQAAVARELDLPKKDPRPRQAASAGRQPKAQAAGAQVLPSSGAAGSALAASVTKERAFAHPARPAAYHHGGEEQLLENAFRTGSSSYQASYTRVLGLTSKDVEIKPLRVGAKVVAGTILGRVGKTQTNVAAHLLFEIRPAGKGSPRIDPKPILDGWKLLESTAIYRAAGRNPFFGPDARNPSIGQILLMSKESLQHRVLVDPRVQIYSCGRRDVRAGMIDRRVLATLEFLSASGLKPTVSSLECSHGILTSSGNVSEHASGDAVDIAAINGIPIVGHQGEGSITDITIRRLLTLQGTMKPHQIISLMTFAGASNTLSLPDHADHIHIGFKPLDGSQSTRTATLKPKQWLKLISRLGRIANPTVAPKPSKYAIAARDTPPAHTARQDD